MKVGQIKESFENLNAEEKKSISKIEILEKLGIEIQNYLPAIYKTMFVNDMVLSCIDTDNNNMKVIDFCQKKLSFEIYLMRDYVGIEFDEDDVLNEYDFLKENGIINAVIDNIPYYELSDLGEMVDRTFHQEVTISNSIEGVIANGINGLVSKIPNTKEIDKWIKAGLKSIKNFNPENYSKLNELLDLSTKTKKELDDEVKDVQPKKSSTKSSTKTKKTTTKKVEKVDNAESVEIDNK